MRIVDLHSHWGTERGYVLRSADALAQQKSTWNSTPTYDTEEQMAAYLRANQVKTILDFGTCINYTPTFSARSSGRDGHYRLSVAFIYWIRAFIRSN